MPKYLFGPVPSRRLGMSLGVDLVPYKTCSLNCIYCECGETTELILARREYIPTDDILAELDQFLAPGPELDFLTFSGAGEPTLHSGIERIVDFLKEKYGQYKICLLTNATLLGDECLAQSLKKIDLIVPSLDAAFDQDFRRINRPVEGLCLENIIHNLIHFRKLSRAEYWLEIFVVPGINDSSGSIAKFVEVVALIMPDKVQINTLDRPGCVDWIRPATREECQPFADALSTIAPVEIIGKFKKEGLRYEGNTENLEKRVSELISRRPYTVEDVMIALNLQEEPVRLALAGLEKKGLVLVEKRERGFFYRLKS